MTVEPTTWRELKAAREAEAPAIQAGREKARCLYALGAQVRERRLELGLTQAELASRVATTQAAVARLELGGSEPALRTLSRLATALEVEFVVDGKDVRVATAPRGQGSPKAAPRPRRAATTRRPA